MHPGRQHGPVLFCLRHPLYAMLLAQLYVIVPDWCRVAKGNLHMHQTASDPEAHNSTAAS